MKRKFKYEQWWSTILPISSTRTNHWIKKTTYGVGVTRPGLGQVQTVKEFTTTLVINVVPTFYNSNYREKQTYVYHWFVSLI